VRVAEGLRELRSTTLKGDEDLNNQAILTDHFRELMGSTRLALLDVFFGRS